MNRTLITLGLAAGLAACSDGGTDVGRSNDAGVVHGSDAGSSTDASSDGATGTTMMPSGTGGTGGGSVLCGDTRARITGTTLAPNGHDPIPNVLVYLVDDAATLRPITTSLSCEQCMDPTGALLSVNSSRTGAFALQGDMLDPGGTYTLVFESGSFRHVERHVHVDRCGQVALAPAQSSLPGASAGEDTAPRIAIADLGTDAHSGDVNDDFAHVLDAIGITGYDRFDPDKTGAPAAGSTAPEISALLTDPTRLAQYQIVIAPCGTLGNFTVAPHVSAAMSQNLQGWLAGGGRLYASDLAYSLIDRAIPGAIAFPSGTPSRDDPAIIGVGLATGTRLNATVDDADLRAWLATLGAMESDGTSIAVSELRDPWGAIDQVAPSPMAGMTLAPRAVTYVSGDVQWHQLETGTNHHPLTVQVDYPGASGGYCGRVVFSSYHVQSTTSATLSPQERVMEYLFFQLATCIQPPG